MMWSFRACFHLAAAAAMLSAAPLSAAQPVPATMGAATITAENFTEDALFREYIVDSMQMYTANLDQIIRTAMTSAPMGDPSVVPSLQSCLDGVKEGGFQDLVAVVLKGLGALSPAERDQLAAFAALLHTDDGARIITLNREAMAASGTLDPASGMPAPRKDMDAKLKQAQHLVETHLPLAPYQMPQAALILGSISRILAQESPDLIGNRFASPACQAMKKELDAYAKAHPDTKP